MPAGCRRSVVLILVALMWLSGIASAEHPPFFDRIQTAFQTRDEEAYLSLFASDVALQQLEKMFFQKYLAFQSVRTVMRLADSSEERLRIQVLIQAEEEARFESWSVEIGEEDGRPVILSKDVVSTVDGLYRLRMSPAAYPVRDVEISHLQARIRLKSGTLFPITAGGELAGALFLGIGEFSLAPPDRTEQQQVRLFCGSSTLEAPIQHFYIRASETMLKEHLGEVLSGQPAPDAAMYARAQQITADSDRNAFGVRLPFSEELWFPLLHTGDIYSEIGTGRGTLVYQHAPNELEDVLLADKDHDRIVSLYSSRSRGIRVVEREDFRILSYRMNLKYAPGEMLLSGTAEILLSSRETNSSVVFKLNPALRVSEVQSSQGPLLYFQEKSTNNLHVILNQVVEEAENVRLRFHYEGVIPPDKGRAETQISATQGDTDFFLPPTYLYSNQAQWYPQLTSKPYSQVETTIEVPEGYAAIANGQLVRMEQNKSRSVYTYASDLPVKYFSLLVGRLRGTLERESIVPLRVFYYSIDKSSAGKQADATDRILRYYAGYFGRYPYRSLNLALRPAEEPGGHAPAGVVITNRVFSILRAKFERDPLYIPAYPDFLLAHEIAHQWWGQAVGWRSYRDQWLSEGFAQFAAAEYIRSVYGDKAWIKISEEFRDWIEEKTAAGPIVLGTRLGHLTNDPRAFSALLYNKGAYVLNMLKGWLGDEQFRKCLAEFYELYRYKKAGVEDFILLAREYSQEDLTPFFEQWLHGWTIPQVTWSWSSEPFETGHLLRLRFRQPADDLYHLKVPVEATDRSGQTFRVQALINSPDQQIEIQLPFAPSTVIVDPLRENLAVYIASK